MTALAAPLPIAVRYTRSVHIERDFHALETALTGYQVTPLVLLTLERILEGLQRESRTRAFSLIGPYGSGKSACALFLGHYLSTTLDTRQHLLAKHGTTDLAQRNLPNAPRLLPVLLSGNNGSLRHAVLATLRASLIQWDHFALNHHDLLHRLDQTIDDSDIDPEAVARLVEQTTHAVASSTPFAGLLLIIDELGQHLDYAARQDERDLFVLQTLAEMAARSGETPCVIVTILHQAFERYAGTAGITQRIEWAKVQGRFVDVPFQEPVHDLLRMVGRAICPDDHADPYATTRRAWAAHMVPLTEQLEVRPASFDANDWADLVARTYPLHPMVLVALPLLFRQLAQNERSLFAFLTSYEPWSLQDVLLTLPAEGDSLPIYRLSHLSAYVEAALGPSLFARSRGRRWAELAEERARVAGMDSIIQDTLTVIGTLNALGRTNELRASESRVSFALHDTLDAPEVLGAIQQLQVRQHIIYRQHRDSFVLWEGSDLDLDGMVQTARQSLGARLSLVALLQDHTNLVPFVARRHSYRTGAVRHFDVRFVEADALPATMTLPTDIDGEILYLVPADDEMLSAAQVWAQHTDRAAEPQRVVVLPQRVQRLRDLLIDVAALQHILDNQPELEHDQVARRELSSQLIEAQHILADAIAQAYSPQFSQWWWCGEQQSVHTIGQLDEFLSSVCDTVYPHTPTIWNELIVRHHLPSASAKARRNLMEAMLEHGHETRLGLVGNPPERAIYESVLHRSGIHRSVGDDLWGFGAPSADDLQHVQPVWEAIQTFIESTASQARPITALYDTLLAPPYGVKSGLLPILLMAAYLADAGEIALYEHGNFAPVPDIALFERLLRQPGYFSLRLSRVRGVRTAVYERLAHVLAPKALTRTVQPAMLDAATPLLRFVRTLPEYSQSTQHLSRQARAIRQALLDARAPDELIFDALPRACGLAPFPDDAVPNDDAVEVFFRILREGLMELQAAYPDLLNHITARIQAAFKSSTTDRALLRHELLERYEKIAGMTAESQIRALGARLKSSPETDAWVESIGALVRHKSVARWYDSDVTEFDLRIADLGRRFRMVEDIAITTHETSQPAQVMRLGLTDAQGERSIVVRHTEPDPAMHAFQADIRAAMEKHAHLTEAQRIQILMDMLRPLLDEAQQDETDEQKSDTYDR
jgi:hypothetical protein